MAGSLFRSPATSISSFFVTICLPSRSTQLSSLTQDTALRSTMKLLVPLALALVAMNANAEAPKYVRSSGAEAEEADRELFLPHRNTPPYKPPPKAPKPILKPPTDEVSFE